MPVEVTHSEFPAPAGDTIIWRYMSFVKLLDLIHTGELFFTNLSALRAEDPFEGKGTLADHRFSEALKDPSLFKQTFGDTLPDDLGGFLRRAVADPAHGHAELCYVSCWHANSSESAALWKIYSASHGVAIRSTVARLASSIKSDRSFTLGGVTYADYNVALSHLGNLLRPVFRKRLSYAYEQEVRLLYWAADEWNKPAAERASWAKGELGIFGVTDAAPPNGLRFACDPAEVIDEIVLSPYAEGWELETMMTTLERIGCKSKVTASGLLQSPPEPPPWVAPK